MIKISKNNPEKRPKFENDYNWSGKTKVQSD